MFHPSPEVPLSIPDNLKKFTLKRQRAEHLGIALKKQQDFIDDLTNVLTQHITFEGPGVLGSLSPCTYQPPLGLPDPSFESCFESLDSVSMRPLFMEPDK